MKKNHFCGRCIRCKSGGNVDIVLSLIITLLLALLAGHVIDVL